MRRVLPLAVLTTACGELDAAQAQHVYLATYDISAEVQNTASNLLAGAGAKDLTLGHNADGYTVVGDLDSGNSWDGKVQVYGSGSYQDPAYDLDLATTYVDVYHGSQDVWLDGKLELVVSYSFPDPEATKVWNLHYDVEGSVVADGAARGDVEVAYSLDIEFDGSVYLYAADGTVGGFDVARMDISG